MFNPGVCMSYVQNIYIMVGYVEGLTEAEIDNEIKCYISGSKC